MAAEVGRDARTGTRRALGRRLVLFPMSFQGHINPVFQLATLLFDRGFSITVVRTRFNAPDPTNYPSFRFCPIDDRPGRPHPADEDLIGRIIAINDGCREPFRDRMAALLEEGGGGARGVPCLGRPPLLNEGGGGGARHQDGGAADEQGGVV